jgi:ribonuclease HII
MDAMAAAVLGLIEKLSKIDPQKNKIKCHILIDGNRIPPRLSLTNTLTVGDQTISLKYEAIVKGEYFLLYKTKYVAILLITIGDASIFSIAAASIIAKVTRDRYANSIL